MISHRARVAFRERILPVITLACLACIMPLRAADEVTNAQAGETFRKAFRPGMELQERVNKLESVLLQHDPNKWTDDAIWALAEFAMRNGYLEQAARLHERLLNRKKLPCLEAFTRTIPLYHTSRVRFEQWILEQTGHRYARGKKPLRAIPYNVLPMSLSGQLGYINERLGRHKRALICYRSALSMCPPRTLLERIYRERLNALQEKLRRGKPEGKQQERKGRPVPEWQRMLQEWEKEQAEKRKEESRENEGKSPSEQEKYEALKELLRRQKNQKKAESDEQS